MNRFSLLLLSLAACNQMIRPTPPEARPRNPSEQRASVVKIESYCGPFEEGVLDRSAIGTGVIVSDWQVLTALHVVDCQSTIPTITVTNFRGLRWKMAPEREWLFEITGAPGRDGISRLQMASGDSFAPGFDPPAITGKVPDFWDPLYIETAFPERHETIGEATGLEYGGSQYGGTIFTYEANTDFGNSGSPAFDINGYLVGIHLGKSNSEKDVMLRYGGLVTADMVPHR